MEEKQHYAAIKSLSRLLGAEKIVRMDIRSSAFLHQLPPGILFRGESRPDILNFVPDNDAVKVEMPERGSVLKFHDGQNQFKVPFIMYADFESILQAHFRLL